MEMRDNDWPKTQLVGSTAMNKTWENRLSMYHGVDTVLTENAPLYAELAALVAASKSFSDLLAKLGAKSIEVDEATKGKTRTKAQAEDDLVDVLMPVGSALWAYATASRDTEMAARTRINDSMLRRVRDTELLGKAKGVHAEAAAKLAGLADYGITQPTLDDLSAKIEAYSAALGNRESSVAERIGAREALAGLFAEADSVLEQIDAIMELMRANSVQFYNEYFAARVIKDVGIRHRAEEPAAEPQGAK